MRPARPEDEWDRLLVATEAELAQTRERSGATQTEIHDLVRRCSYYRRGVFRRETRETRARDHSAKIAGMVREVAFVSECIDAMPDGDRRRLVLAEHRWWIVRSLGASRSGRERPQGRVSPTLASRPANSVSADRHAVISGGCPRCHGSLMYDAEDSAWRCVACGRTCQVAAST
jgi:hypothetical protein